MGKLGWAVGEAVLNLDAGYRAIGAWFGREVGWPGSLVVGGGALAVNGVYALWGDGWAYLVGGVGALVCGVIGGLRERA